MFNFHYLKNLALKMFNGRNKNEWSELGPSGKN